MSVQDGQNVNAAITNAALMSRLNDTSTIGKVDILNTTETTLPTNGALNVSGGVGIEKSLNVALDANIDGNLSVDGSSTLSAITATTLNATGNIITTAAVQGNDLIATDSVSTDVLTTTGQADIGGVLNVTGDSNLSTVSSTGLAELNSLQVTTSATVGTTLGVTGNTTLSTLSTTGLATLDSAQITNNLTVQGNLTVDGTLTSVNSATLEVTDQNILVNNGGNDASSEGAGLTIERTGTSGSLIYKAASASKFAAGPLGSEIDLVDVSSVQTLTNKTISAASISGTVPIASGGTGQTTAVAAFDALAPTTTKGDLIVHNGTDNVRLPVGTDNQVLVPDSAEPTGLKWTDANFGGGGGGAINFIENGGSEDGTSIWVAYNDRIGNPAVDRRPIDGSGGLPTVSQSVVGGGLSGDFAVLLTKPASDCQGQGWSTGNIDIPQEFRAKSLRHYLAYLVQSGLFVAGSNGSSPTDGDLIAYFWDVTNGKIVESSNIKFFASSTTVVDSQQGNVQFDLNCTTVRMLLHVASQSTAAWTLKIDSALLSPQLVNQGSIITLPQSYTPVFSNLGTPTAVDIKWWQVGPNIEIQGRFTNGTVGAGTASFTLPPGLVNALTNSGIVGTYGQQGSTTGNLLFMGAGGNTVFFSMSNWQVGATGTQLATSGFTTIQMSVPIAGWSGSVKMSEPYDGRFQTARVRRSSTSQVIANNTSTKVLFNTENYDTVGLFDTGLSRYLVQSSGYYNISGNLSFQSTGASVTALRAMLYRNGADYGQWAYSSKPSASAGVPAINFFFQDYFVAGDYIEIWVNQENASAISLDLLSDATIPGGSNAVFQKSDTGSQTIASGEKIRMSYTQTSGQSIPNNTPTTFLPNVKENDTHSVFNVSTGEITFPRAGFGQIKAGCLFAASSPSATFLFSIFKDNVLIREVGRYTKPTQNTNDSPNPICVDVEGIAGTKYRIAITQTTGAPLSLLSSAAYNYLQFSMD